MKRILNNSKLLAVAIFALVTLGAEKTFASKTGGDPVAFKFIGNTDNHPVFLLNVNNSVSEKFVVTLKDLSGRTLYSENIEGVQITRTYRVEAEGIESGITVEINSKKDNTKSVYSIKSTSHVVDDVTIERL